MKCDPDEYSDHCALLIHLNSLNIDNYFCSSTDTNEPAKSIHRLVWSCEKEEAFRNTLLQQSDKYNDLINSLESDSSSVNDVMNNFSSLLFDDAYQYFGKYFKTGNSTQSQLKFKTQSNPWFYDTCREAKQPLSL